MNTTPEKNMGPKNPLEETSFLDHALRLARLGFHVFPLVRASKLPAISGYPVKASLNETQIKAWWKDPVLAVEKDLNVGISTSCFGTDGHALLVVDVDVKEGRRGDHTLMDLELEGFTLPPTYTQSTPSGGRHFFFKVDVALKQGVNTLGLGIDTRSRGGYVVGSGSCLGGGLYTDNGLEVADLPSWIHERCPVATQKIKSNVIDLADVNLDRALKRGEYFLSFEAPLAIQGQGGDQTTFIVAAHVKDMGVPEEIVLELMLEHWNPRCNPQWGEDELRQKVAHAFRYGANPAGIDAPEKHFDPVTEEEAETIEATKKEKEREAFLEKMNERHAIVFSQGAHSILDRGVNEEGLPVLHFLNEITFRRLYSNMKITGGRKKNWADMWLDWPKRKEYRGVCFLPEKEAQNGALNLWQGFSCAPLSYEEANEKQRRGFDAFIEHAKLNVCGGDESLFMWLMGYFAHLVQRPWERPLTTLVFRGKKGTGKNALIDRVGALLGHGHYLVAHDGRYLTSNFNGHMDKCLCLVLDEAFWSGDKSAEGKLKGITTAPKILIEHKGKDPYIVNNLVRVVVIGNEDWLVPASADERRYAVFTMGDARRMDNSFFHRMRVDLDELGGGRVLLDYLKNFDLDKVDINTAPVTHGLFAQKIESLDIIGQWWHEVLREGRLVHTELADWVTWVDTSTVRDSFTRFMRDKNARGWVPSAERIGRQLKTYCGPGLRRSKRREKEATVWIYQMPPLDEARSQFAAHLGHEMDWEAP